jgi:hypothetical protein
VAEEGGVGRPKWEEAGRDGREEREGRNRGRLEGRRVEEGILHNKGIFGIFLVIFHF